MRPLLARLISRTFHFGRGRILKNKKVVCDARDADVL
jgi:hypothetical protein